MKKIVMIIATLCICSSAYAIEFFFEKSVGYWTILGHPGNAERKLNPACITTTTWKDGSYLNIIQDLADGELFLEFKSSDWDITDADLNAEYELRINVYTRNKEDVESWPTKFKFLSKNSINIRGLDYKTFLPAFMNYSKMVFIMPGTIPNGQIELQNSTKAIDLMGQCLDAAKIRKFESNTENGSIQKQGV